MSTTPCGSRTVFMCPIMQRSGSWYYMKLMLRHTRYTPKYQDVFGLEGAFLVDRYEEGYYRVCSNMWCMLESGGRTSEAGWIASAYADTQMEVGQAWHGFHHRFAQDPIRIWFYLGSSGSLDQSSSLYPSEDHLYKCEVGQDIYDQDRMSARSSEDHCIR